MERRRRNQERARPPWRWLLLVKHEAGLALRKPMLHACVALMAILAGLSASLGLRDVAAANHDYTTLLQRQLEAQLQPDSVMGWSADARLRAVRSPAAGGALAKGIEPSLPLYWDFSPSGVRWGPRRASTLHLEGGLGLDLGLLFLTIGGLLAGMYGVDIVARARTSGTMLAWLSLPLPSTLVVSATLTAAALVAAYAVLAVQVGVVAATAITRPPELDMPAREILSLVAPIGLPAMLFLLFMTTLGAAVRLRAVTDAGAHLAQTALWAVIALVMPYLTSTAARLIVPVAPRAALEHAASEAYANRIHDAESRLGLELVSRTDGPTDLRALTSAIERHRSALEDLWSVAARDARAEVDAIEQAWWAARRRQAAVARGLDWLSPGTLLLRSVHAAGGTGPALGRTWEDAVEAYQDRLNRHLFDERARVTIRVPAGAGGQWLRFDRRPAPKLRDLPQFERPRIERLGPVRGAGFPLIGLAVYLVLTTASAARLFPTRLTQVSEPATGLPDRTV
jgi:hypothetical protein